MIPDELEHAPGRQGEGADHEQEDLMQAGGDGINVHSFNSKASVLEDGEPDIEIPLEGGTPKTNPRFLPDPNRPFGYSVIYLESLRDLQFGVRKPSPNLNRGLFNDPNIAPGLARDYTNRLYALIAHELGHAPGRQSEASDHREDGIMDGDAPPSLIGTRFVPGTVARFRKAQSWTQ